MKPAIISEILGGILVLLLAIAGQAAGRDGATHADKAWEFHRKLSAENREQDYLALEDWVFAKGLSVKEHRARVADGIWALTRDKSSQRYQSAKERWADRFRERLRKEHGDQWWGRAEEGRLLSLLGGYLQLEGETYRRGYDFYDQNTRSAHRRDEALARQAYRDALHLIEPAIRNGRATNDELAAVCIAFAGEFESWVGDKAWKLTDLTHVPEIAPYYRMDYWHWGPEDYLVEGRSPAIGPDDQWRLPRLRNRFAEAQSDGERVYWLLNRAREISPKHAPRAAFELANRWSDLLGVDGMIEGGYIYLEGTESEFDPEAPGEFELHTLKDHETFVVGVEGPARRLLPEGSRFVDMLRELVEDEKTPDDVLVDALGELLWSTLPNRYRYGEAERLARLVLARNNAPDAAREDAQEFLDSIAPDGSFADNERRSFSPGQGATVSFISRGIDRQAFDLWRLDLDAFLGAKDHEAKRQVQNLVMSPYSREYDETPDKRLHPLFRRVHQWVVPIRKKANHLQTVTPVAVPEVGTGIYLLVARLPTKLVTVPVHLNRTILVNAPIEEGEDFSSAGRPASNFFLIDATNGRPVDGAEVEGLSDDAKSFSDHTGYLPGLVNGGLFVIRRPGLPAELIEMEGQSQSDAIDPAEVRGLFLTNQPLYRPGQEVAFAGWVKRPNWRGPGQGEFTRGSRLRIEVSDPVGQIIHHAELVLDEFGGFAGSFRLASEMVLGACRVQVEYHDAETMLGDSDDPFGPDLDPEDPGAERRWAKLELWSDQWIEVGEFRKPDFRVSVSAEHNAETGAVVAVVEAGYLSGEPVKGGKVTAHLRGSPYLGRYLPERSWDFLYDPGFDWPLERSFLPGWQDWEIWFDDGLGDEQYWDLSYVDLELTATGVTGETGMARLEFRPSLPLLGRFDYDFEVEASVQEFTGRTARASDHFSFSGREFEVFVMPEKGFYHEGEPIALEVRTMDRDRQPLAGHGELRIETIAMVDGHPVFSPVLCKKVTLDQSGRKDLQLANPGPGQYRCLIEGGGSERGFVLEVIGELEAAGHCDGVQLIADQRVVAVGDEIEVLVKTEAEEALVWFFEVLPDGVRRSPRLIETKGHLATVKLPVHARHVPNYFLHAGTVVHGQFKAARFQVVVPPEDSRLHLKLAAHPQRARPGDEAKVEVTVHDHAGKPVQAAVALTVYDEALSELGGPLATTDRLREQFYGHEDRLMSSHSRWPWTGSAIWRLPQPGDVMQRGDFAGDPRWKPTARWEKLGPDLWIAYEPPELPNQVGGFFGMGGGGFPVTPATPTAYSRLLARPRERVDPELGKVSLRRRFEDNAFWAAGLRTGADGRTRAGFNLPDNLTAWRVQAWAIAKGQAFGDARIELQVAKELQLRPTIPRAAVVGDELVVSTLIQNLSGQAHEIEVTLDVHGAELDGEAKVVTLEPGEEGLAEWQVVLTNPGDQLFRFRARSVDGNLTEGIEAVVPVAAKSAQAVVVARDRIEPGEKGTHLELKLAEEVAEAKFQVRIEGESAAAALAVLPDLVAFPHGCVEQTMNRFLPLLIAWRSADKLGLDWQKMQTTALCPQHSIGWVRGRDGRAVSSRPAELTEKKVRDMIFVGLNRLKELRNDHGSWGWFSGHDAEEAVYLTALALRGILEAKELGFHLEEDLAYSGLTWLQAEAQRRAVLIAADPIEAKPVDALIVYVLERSKSGRSRELQSALLKARSELPTMALIQLALSLGQNNEKERIALVEQVRERIGVPEERLGVLRWWDDPVETRAWHLKLLVQTGAEKDELHLQIKKLLALRADGVRWKSTRDSALAVEAIVQAALSCGDVSFGPDQDIDLALEVAGRPHHVLLNRENLWSQNISLDLADHDLQGRAISVSVSGQARLPVSVTATLHHESGQAAHLQERIDGMRVIRRYYRVDESGERSAWNQDDSIRSGELIEVELRIEAGQDRHFVHLRDPIPAGLEPVVQLSGYKQGCYRESRTGETNFFFSRLSAWNGVQRYYLRAVARGTTTALPARAGCMYAPGVFGRSAARTLVVE